VSVPTTDPRLTINPEPEPPLEEVQATFCATLADEWARGGVTDAVVCPGSRSTPLAVALAGDAGIRVQVRLDERSAGFFALGIAKASARPVVVLTTSGTAAAELHAAVVEAFHGGVPLIVCTADRPERLQGVGAPQVIDQLSLFGRSLRWSAAPGVPSWREGGTWRSLASRSVAEASAGPLGPGPVHLNLAFEEPLVGVSGEMPEGRPDGRPWHEVVRGGDDVRAVDPQVAELLSGPKRRVLVVAGSGSGPAADVLGMAADLGAPLIADPLSGCRVRHDAVVASADSILRSEAIAEALRPEVVIRLGGPPASKILAIRLHEWAIAGTDQILVDRYWRFLDPDRDAGTLVTDQPGSWCRSVSGWLQSVVGRGEAVVSESSGAEWSAMWSSAEAAAQEVIRAWCSRHPEATEPGVARALLEVVPAESTIVVASSMPVRDVEWFGPALGDPPTVFANRGANGIDGVVSTACGVASAVDGPVVAVVGDLAFLHDLTALVSPAPIAPNLTVVVVDNDGGGIFSFLGQRGGLDPGTFENLFATPQATDIAKAAAGLGLAVTEVSSIAELEQAIGIAVTSEAASLLHVSVPGRDANVAHHAEITEEVAARLQRTPNLLGCS
jgi:2-succinyl-5-enolpyruvyl-6-hydroxy-3-cyclohexene-1-carboxylate synthase